MPIYEYRCECGIEGERFLPLTESNKPQTCECGEVMHRKVSVSSFAIKQYGKQMALDGLNAKGSGFPSRNDDLRARGIRATAAGLERPPKTIW